MSHIQASAVVTNQRILARDPRMPSNSGPIDRRQRLYALTPDLGLLNGLCDMGGDLWLFEGHIYTYGYNTSPTDSFLRGVSIGNEARYDSVRKCPIISVESSPTSSSKILSFSLLLLLLPTLLPTDI